MTPERSLPHSQQPDTVFSASHTNLVHNFIFYFLISSLILISIQVYIKSSKWWFSSRFFLTENPDKVEIGLRNSGVIFYSPIRDNLYFSFQINIPVYLRFEVLRAVNGDIIYFSRKYDAV